LLVEFRHFFMVLPKYFFKICVTLKSLVAWVRQGVKNFWKFFFFKSIFT
jgi:hypothetical protein